MSAEPHGDAGVSYRLRSGLVVRVPMCNPTLPGIRKMQGWLLETFRAEATARHDEYAGGLFERAEAGRLPPADVDMLNEYVFGSAERVSDA